MHGHHIRTRPILSRDISQADSFLPSSGFSNLVDPAMGGKLTSCVKDHGIKEEKIAISSKSPPGKQHGKRLKHRECVALMVNDHVAYAELMANSLSKSGCDVIVVMEGFNALAASSLLKIPQVTVVFNDSSTNPKKIASSIEGADRAIMITSKWEKFEDVKEEQKALALIVACMSLEISQVIFSTIENLRSLKKKGLESQITDKEPTFAGMKRVRSVSKKAKVQLLHMITSYRDYNKSNASLCLVSSGKGQPITMRASSGTKDKSDMKEKKKRKVRFKDHEKHHVEDVRDRKQEKKIMSAQEEEEGNSSSLYTGVVTMLAFASMMATMWLTSRPSSPIEPRLSQIAPQDGNIMDDLAVEEEVEVPTSGLLPIPLLISYHIAASVMVALACKSLGLVMRVFLKMIFFASR